MIFDISGSMSSSYFFMSFYYEYYRGKWYKFIGNSRKIFFPNNLQSAFDKSNKVTMEINFICKHSDDI